MKLIKIKEIKKVGKKKTIDIQVSKNNLFIANNILTHNSSFNTSSPGMESVAECIEINQTITLKNGTVKKIGDVKLGDQICANDGFKTVTHIFPKKIKQCYKITLKSGKEIIVSGEHKFPTPRGRISIVAGLRIRDRLNSIVCKKENTLLVKTKQLLTLFASKTGQTLKFYLNKFTDSLIDYNDEITGIELVEEKETIDITVTGDNLFYCNGILTKNSIALPATCDIMLSIWQTDEDKELGVVNMGMQKNRFGPNFGQGSFKCNYETLTLKEVNPDHFESEDPQNALNEASNTLDKLTN
jgi:hypothetical protein